MSITAVNTNSRKVGDKVKVYDTFNGYNNLSYTGEIVHITKKYLTIRHPLGSESRYHRATGYIVGFSFPSYCFAIAPETSK